MQNGLTQGSSVWQPSTWVELLQIVVSFLTKLVSRSSILSDQKLTDTRSHIVQLQQAFHAFQGSGSFSGENALNNSLDKLDRYVQIHEVSVTSQNI